MLDKTVQQDFLVNDLKLASETDLPSTQESLSEKELQVGVFGTTPEIAE